MSEDKNKHPAWNYVDDSNIDPVTKKRVYKCKICGLCKPGQWLITQWASHIVGRAVENEPRLGIQASTGGPTDESHKA